MFLFLIGCSEQNKEDSTIKKEGHFNIEHYLLPELIVIEAPKPLIIEKREITDEGFAEVDGLLNAIKASKRRGDRQWDSKKRRQTVMESVTDLSEENYKNNVVDDEQYIRKDVSSLPINRDRLLTSDMHISAI